MKIKNLKGDLLLVEMTPYYYNYGLEILENYFNNRRINYGLLAHDPGSAENYKGIELGIITPPQLKYEGDPNKIFKGFYFGNTSNAKSRIMYHKKWKEIQKLVPGPHRMDLVMNIHVLIKDETRFTPAIAKYYDIVEKALIYQHKPLLNSHYRSSLHKDVKNVIIIESQVIVPEITLGLGYGPELYIVQDGKEIDLGVKRNDPRYLKLINHILNLKWVEKERKVK